MCVVNPCTNLRLMLHLHFTFYLLDCLDLNEQKRKAFLPTFVGAGRM